MPLVDRASYGYYFIPFLNLVLPYQAMKEIWQASRNPKDWRSEPGSPLLGWWWALWLISGLVGQILFRRTLRADSVEELKTTTEISLVSGFIDVALSLVAIWLVQAISRRQEQLIQGSFR